MEQALKKLNEEEDDLDSFGRFVATELRGIKDIQKRNVVKRKLNRFLMDQLDEIDGITQYEVIDCNNLKIITIPPPENQS